MRPNPKAIAIIGILISVCGLVYTISGHYLDGKANSPGLAVMGMLIAFSSRFIRKR